MSVRRTLLKTQIYLSICMSTTSYTSRTTIWAMCSKDGSGIQTPISTQELLRNLTLPTDSIWQSRVAVQDMCIEVEVAGDNNSANDRLCNELSYTNDTEIDFTPENVQITVPDLTDGSELESEEQIFQLMATVRNVGKVTLPRDYQVKVANEMLGATKNYSRITETAVDTGETFEIMMVNFVKAPKEAGNFPVCLTTTNADDKNATNDEKCIFFVVKESEIPDGIDGIDDSVEYLHYANGSLYIDVTEPISNGALELYNNNGALVHSTSISADAGVTPFGIPNLSSGIYIVRLSDKNGKPMFNQKIGLK